ncbi:MAG: hypothetical protein AB1489_42520 [Acidobacteriota bacterium]
MSLRSIVGRLSFRRSDSTSDNPRRDSVRADRGKGFTDGLTILGRNEGHRKFHLFISTLMNFLLLILCYWSVYSHRQELTTFIDKGFIVYQIDNGQTKALAASDFRYAATDEEIQWLALHVIENIVSAGSNNTKDKYNEAMKWMGADTRTEFEKILASPERINELKELGIDRKFEGGEARFLTEKDLASDNQQQLTRFDVVVTGRVDTYREGTNQLLTSNTVAYRVKLKPVSRRSKRYPSALVVETINKLENLQQNDNNTAN